VFLCFVDCLLSIVLLCGVRSGTRPKTSEKSCETNDCAREQTAQVSCGELLCPLLAYRCHCWVDKNRERTRRRFQRTSSAEGRCTDHLSHWRHSHLSIRLATIAPHPFDSTLAIHIYIIHRLFQYTHTRIYSPISLFRLDTSVQQSSSSSC
jgi:hypothetical protein